MFTNRLFKTLSKYATSKDDLRPEMQGVATDGHNFVATDIAIIAESAQENRNSKY